MKKNKLKFILSVSLTLILSYSGLAQKAENLNKTIPLKELMSEDKLNVEVKEFFIRRIRKTSLVKDIDNHEFVHYFIDRFELKYKNDIVQALKDQNKATLTYAEILAISDSIVADMAKDFNNYKISNPSSSKTYNDGKIEERSFAFIDMDKQKKGKGSNDKGLNEPCNNADYETGDGTGWDFTEGDVDNNPYGYVNVVPSSLASTQFTMMTGAGMDAVTGAFPVVNPDGGAFSLMVGDGTGTGYRAASVSQTFLVDANSEAFTYSYALVLEDPSGHSLGEKPYFKVNMYDQSGASITCGDYEVISGPVSSGGDPDFIAYSGGFYLPWRTTFAPLQGYVGQNVTIEFIIGDCGQGGHYGYGYIDASCQPLEIIPSQTVICGGAPVTLTAPAGAASYLWSPGGQTTQSITTNVPGNYSVDVIPVTGPACALTLTATIGGSPDYPVAEFNASPTTVCAGTPITFNNTSYVVGTSSIDSVEWDFDSDGIVDDTNFNTSYTYPTAGNYAVTLTVYNNGCDDDTTINVTVTPGTTADFTSTTVCQGSSTSFNDVSLPGGTVVNWSWDFDGDGVIDDNTQNPTYIFPSAGTFPVELSVSGAGGSCPSDTIINVTVNPNPVADFSADTVCYGSLTTFTDNSNISSGAITNWSWDFGDAAGTSVAQNPTYTYLTNNTFTTELIVVSDSGCVDTTTLDVYLHNLPVVDFTPDTACAGNNSAFVDATVTAAGVQIWSWDFDNDGNPDDNTQNPTYVFPGAATYPVTLSVVDSNGCTHDTTKNVYVSPQPTADFSSSNECYGASNNFNDLSNANGGTITNWDWDFDNNGSVDDTNQNPTNGYPSAGSYTVELLVTTQLGCVDSITKQVTVHPIPVADFSVADVCLNEVSNFYDSSTVATGNIIDWQWDFDSDGNIDDTNQNPTNTYATDGTFAVTLTVTSDSGCINTYVDSATVDPLPTAAFSVNNICVDTAAIFTDNSNGNGGTIANWEWDFDGDGTVDDINQNPTNQYSTHGQYNVQLIVSTAAGCADTVVQPIDIYPMPVADFTFQNQCYATPIPFTDNSVVATGAITGWEWDFGNSNTSIAQNPSENYAGQGVYTVELIVTTDNGCKDTVSYNNIEVYPTPVVDFTPTDVCLNAPTPFQDLSNVSNMYTTNNITNWDWDFGDGVGISNQQSPTYTYAQEGTYPAQLIVVSNHGCTDSLIKNVTVHPLPTVSFEGPAQGCSPVCAQMVNNSAITSGTIDQWIWKFGDGATSGAEAPPYCWYNDSRTSPESYDVTLIAVSNYGCVDSLVRPALVTSYPIPQASFTFNPLETDIYDSEITFTDQSIIASEWFWELGDGSTSTNQNPVHTYADSGTYVVNLYIENVYGCRDTATKNVVIDPTFAIWIPNVFTPDGDGINDYWFSDGYGITQLQTLVFDRWGALVFEGYQLDSKWDGTYKGKMSVQDTYVYKIKARDVFGEWHEFVGRVTLLK